MHLHDENHVRALNNSELIILSFIFAIPKHLDHLTFLHGMAMCVMCVSVCVHMCAHVCVS